LKQVRSGLFRDPKKENQMEVQTEELLLEKCRQLIEHRLDWGSSNDWTSQDFESLSNQIAEVTHVRLSAATLKRIWGKIKYDSKPTVNTLNALAQYLGFENWRGFKQAQSTEDRNGSVQKIEQETISKGEKPTKRNKKNTVFVSIVSAILAGSAIFLEIKSKDSSIDTSRYSFSSKKVIDEGVPNTVVFNYDASAASETDSVFIQQSWDKQLSRQVDRNQKVHTSIYYYPGYFEAKLRINSNIIKEHRLYIKTKGWLPIVDQKPVPVYFNAALAIHDGIINLPLDKIKEYNVALQPHPPWTSYYFVNDLGSIFSDDFVFETEIRNEYKDGTAACQHTEIHLLFAGASLIIPLSAKGCVSELKFEEWDGKKTDLSAFGVDFDQWIKVTADVSNQEGRVSINDKKAFDFTTISKPMKLVGLAFRFRGTGSVDAIRISNHNGQVLFEENF
jgi:hypothetical protein